MREAGSRKKQATVLLIWLAGVCRHCIACSLVAFIARPPFRSCVIGLSVVSSVDFTVNSCFWVLVKLGTPRLQQSIGHWGRKTQKLEISVQSIYSQFHQPGKAKAQFPSLSIYNTLTMKLTSFALAFLASATAASPETLSRNLQFEEEIQPRAGNANGKGNGPPQHVLDRFSAEGQVKPGRPLFVQSLTGKSVNVGGRSISFDDADLTPVDILSKGARITVDDKEAFFSPMVFQSNQDPDVIITKDPYGKLLSASKRGSGKHLDVLPLDGDNFVTVEEDDLDDALLAQFQLEDAQNPGRRRHLRPGRDNQGTRSLQTTFDVITVDVVVDSLFCDKYGGPTNAAARAQNILAEASMTNFQSFGVKLEIGALILYCDSGSDPIQTIISQLSSPTAGVCGNNDPTYLLPKFKDHVAGDSRLTGDLVHLFHGYDFTGTNTIGCAYIDVLCYGSGYKTGVDEMSFSNTLMSQGKLVSHEIGHNLGANHNPNSGYLSKFALSPIRMSCHQKAH